MVRMFILNQSSPNVPSLEHTNFEFTLSLFEELSCPTTISTIFSKIATFLANIVIL